jgi:hypothetical protein
MKIEFDGPVSSANASHPVPGHRGPAGAHPGPRHRARPVAARRIIVTDELAATEQQLGATPVAGEHLSRIVADGGGSPCSSTAPACGRPSKATAPRSPA